MMESIRSLFGDWERRPVDYPDLGHLTDVAQTRVYLVSKDLPQSVVWMGHLGQSTCLLRGISQESLLSGNGQVSAIVSR